MAPRPNMSAKNWNFLKLLKTMIVWALWLCPGLLSIRILCFLKSGKMTELQPLKRGAKMRAARKNDPNLPNFNIFQ